MRQQAERVEVGPNPSRRTRSPTRSSRSRRRCSCPRRRRGGSCSPRRPARGRVSRKYDAEQPLALQPALHVGEREDHRVDRGRRRSASRSCVDGEHAGPLSRPQVVASEPARSVDAPRHAPSVNGASGQAAVSTGPAPRVTLDRLQSHMLDPLPVDASAGSANTRGAAGERQQHGASPRVDYQTVNDDYPTAPAPEGRGRLGAARRPRRRLRHLRRLRRLELRSGPGRLGRPADRHRADGDDVHLHGLRSGRDGLGDPGRRRRLRVRPARDGTARRLRDRARGPDRVRHRPRRHRRVHRRVRRGARPVRADQRVAGLPGLLRRSSSACTCTASARRSR